MFLDDELLQICRDTICDTPESIQQLNEDLCKKCEKYYKERISKDMNAKNVKVILDKTFNLWDSFTRMAIKEGGKMAILGELFSKYTFKKQLLLNEKLADVYNKL